MASWPWYQIYCVVYVLDTHFGTDNGRPYFPNQTFCEKHKFGCLFFLINQCIATSFLSPPSSLHIHQIAFLTNDSISSDPSEAFVLDRTELHRLQQLVRQLEAEKIEQKDLHHQARQQRRRLIHEGKDKNARIQGEICHSWCEEPRNNGGIILTAVFTQSWRCSATSWWWPSSEGWWIWKPCRCCREAGGWRSSNRRSCSWKQRKPRISKSGMYVLRLQNLPLSGRNRSC